MLQALTIPLLMFSPVPGSSFPPAGPKTSHQPRHHPYMVDPSLEGLLSPYQSLGVAQSTCKTYQIVERDLQQFCTHYAIAAFPASPLTLYYFCCYMASRVSYKTTKLYLVGIRLEHLEGDLEDPTKDELLDLLCTSIKRSQGTQPPTCLPITINVLKILKSQLWHDPSFSPLEKRLLWAAFILAFYGFLRDSKFTTAALIWQHIQFKSDKYIVLIEQSKTDPFVVALPSPNWYI